MDSAQLQQKWPVIAVEGIDRMVDHYVDVLGFSLVDQNEADGKVGEVLLALDDFYLIMREQFVQKDTKFQQPRCSESNQKKAVLYIPVLEAVVYGRDIILRGGKPLTGLLYGPEIREQDYELFYYRDPEGLVLCFATSDGPYRADAWEWNDKIFPDPKSIAECEKSSQWLV